MLLVLTTAACGSIPTGLQPATVPTDSVLPTATALSQTTPISTQAAETPTLLPTTIAAPITPSLTPELALPGELRPQYIITATLDFSWRYLSVVQDLTIPNSSEENISELTLVVQPNWRADVFNLKSITWGNGEAVTGYVLDGIQLRVLLVDPLGPGESLQISIVYDLYIPPILTSEAYGPNPFGYTSRQINLTDWYPFIPPYVEGTGWLVHNPWFYGEHLAYPTADFEVSIQLLNAPTGTMIAASALDTGDGNVYHYQLERARNFVWSVSPEYRVFQEQVGDTTVLGYAFPYDVVPGEAAFRTTVQALELYNELFGPYPYNGLTMIQADFDHGMEYSGLYFLSRAFYNTYDGTPSTYLVTIAAHETAHQWWYGLVGNDPALEPWLDEALCTFSELLYYEHLFPQSLDWWEYSRVNYYNPTGWVDSTLYNTPGYRPYRDAVYLNGALFIRELRDRVGDEAFLEFLKDYAAHNSYQLATAVDFFGILEQHTEASWVDLLTKYFESAQ